MNNSKIILSFFIVSIFSLLFFSNYAFASQVSNFQETVEVCTEITTLTTVLNVTDGTDFDFVQDEDYLIVASAKFAGNSTVNPYILRLQHENTTFAGSEMNYKLPKGNGNCGDAGDGNQMFNYFWFTLWTPNATEATQDIVFEVDTAGGANAPMQFDDVTIQIIHLSNQLTKDVDYFFNEVTTTETLATVFATPNNATITFTPTNNNDDWMVIGSNQIDTGSVVINYDSRIFFNGTISDFPLMSEEGEDPTTDSYVQTLSRFVTLPNTQQQIQMQSQIDQAGAGIHERTYSSIFAINLDKFTEHSGQFIEAPTALGIPLFGDLILTQNHIVSTNNTNIFILADFGTIEKEIRARVQLNQTDVITGMTSQEYKFNEMRDNTDVLRWTTSDIENVINATHTIDVDASTDGASSIYQNLVIFSLDTPTNAFTQTFTDPMSWNDDIRIDLTKVFNDTMSMPDDIRLDLSKNFTDPFSWNDDIRLDLTKVFNDTMSMPDDIRLDLSKNFTDPMSMPDDIRLDLSKNFTDPMSWDDDIRLDLTKVFNDTMSMPDEVLIMIMINFTDPMSMNDDIRLDFSKNITNAFSWTDDIRIDLTKVFNDTMSMPDDIRLDLSKNFTDPFSWTDDINTLRTFIRPFDDPISWTDTINTFTTFASPPIVIPPPVVTGGGAGGQAGVSSPTIPDSDQDGIPDESDQCPLEPETFNQFQDADGCPDSLDRPEPITIADLGFPFEFNELSVIDDFINLETDSPQSQVEDLGIRWLGDEPITITSIQFSESPFEFQTQDIPVTFGNSQFGFSQMQLIYTIQEPDKLCGNTFSFDCIDEITYEIPVTITGEVRGKIVMSTGSITVDNSNRFNPFWLVGIFLVGLPISAFFVFRARSINSNPTAKTKLKVTQAPANKKVTLKTAKPQKAGTTRKLLSESPKTNVLGKKT